MTILHAFWESEACFKQSYHETPIENLRLLVRNQEYWVAHLTPTLTEWIEFRCAAHPEINFPAQPWLARFMRNNIPDYNTFRRKELLKLRWMKEVLAQRS